MLRELAPPPAPLRVWAEGDYLKLDGRDYRVLKVSPGRIELMNLDKLGGWRPAHPNELQDAARLALGLSPEEAA